MQTFKKIDQLIQAEQRGNPAEFLSTETDLKETDAYEFQQKLVSRKSRTGHVPSGFKISMTSPETQALADTDEPAYGTLFNRSLIKNNASVSLSDLNEPLLEPELIFTFTEDLSDSPSAEEIISKSLVSPGLEIPDSRFQNWFPRFKLMDLICDNAFTGRVVTGTKAVPANTLDLADISMNLERNGIPVASGHSSSVMGDPVLSVQWLAGKLCSHGCKVKKGMIVSSGTFIPPVRLTEGKYTAHFSSGGSVGVNAVP
ncbi:2-keto-4-pentenoate hydratase [Alteribacter natronophilus]|uniref:2-keto-4-pentenoate hydratase n=1 Tax=Alteribacter natronophilus TaxID=2583810 RepID=UPI00110F63B5|nr:2-keto-4-pentenoate hydratase [Alteribacter natronophilus]TMW73417.1 2-keto-4-pentenoate hydratase [Alteribacter natronophilus]